MIWDDRCGNVVDPDGYTWMVGTHKPEGAMVFSVPPFTVTTSTPKAGCNGSHYSN
jgi:hypothetical protein